MSTSKNRLETILRFRRPKRGSLGNDKGGIWDLGGDGEGGRGDGGGGGGETGGGEKTGGGIGEEERRESSKDGEGEEEKVAKQDLILLGPWLVCFEFQ